VKGGALVKIVVAVCDICQSDQDVDSYTISSGRRKVVADLCGGHREPLEGLLNKGQATTPARPRKAASKPPAKPGRASRSRIKVTPIDEVR
jgi:hypothetical protein